MIVYKVDASVQKKANAQIQDMATVLSEIAPTLRILRDLVGQHQTSLSTEQIDKYRNDLRPMIDEAIRMTQAIAVNSQRLSSVSDLATKQLAAVEEQISAALQGSTSIEGVTASQTQTGRPAETTNTDQTRPTRGTAFTKTFSRV